MNKTKRRIALVGAGMRAKHFIPAIALDHSATCELVGICDASMPMLDVKRAELAEDSINTSYFHVGQFDQMVRQTSADTVVVLTPDSTHDEFICRAMELGCDVICEKPLTTSLEKCERILATQEKHGRACRVALNYRYSPRNQHIKELLMSGAIGDIVQVTLCVGVSLSHGVKYFHRWHGEKDYSGTLLVHKCCHLFDLVNFWLGATPKRVSASGTLNFFGPDKATRFGLADHGQRCGDCALTERCPYYWDTLTQPTANESAEVVRARGLETGYYRDKCVFRPEIDGYDTCGAQVDYETGAQLNFSWMTGRIGEVICFDGSCGTMQLRDGKIIVRRHDGDSFEVDARTGRGGHGGADPLMFRSLFGDDAAEDTCGCRADLRDGIWSVLVGLGAVESIETGRVVDLTNRLRVARPDYKPMPSASDPIDPVPLRQALQKAVQTVQGRRRLQAQTEADTFDAEG